MSYQIFNSTLPIVRNEIDIFLKNYSVNHSYQKALSIPYFRQKFITKIINSIPNNHILIDQCHPFIDDNFFYIELAKEKDLIHEKICSNIEDIVSEYNDFTNSDDQLIIQKKSKVHHSQKLSWWIRYETTKPTVTYYFGPFENFTEATNHSQDYLEDLIDENAQEITYDIELGNPHQLTVINDLEDLQKENELILRQLWENESENKYYKNLFLQSPDIRLLLDNDLIIKDINYQGNILFNLSVDDLNNKHFTSFIATDSLEKFLIFIQDLKTSNLNNSSKSNFLSLRLSFPENLFLSVSIKISPILDSKGNINGWDLSCHDITEIQKNHDQFYYESRYDCLTNLPNSAMRLDVKIFEAEFKRGGSLQKILLLYTQARIIQVSQNVVCKCHHHIDNQFACWLLHAHDCVGSNELALTQKFIAQMLGVRRASVTQVAQKFQENGIIHYSRGHIRILNRLFLELSACECYTFVKSEFKRLLNFS
ncbi:DUF1816 domain-containing protein [Cyanobacterium aponinum AL20118]|uniref:DUF1816 domain-containing protein n=1 Tax=Cyanobacterium aponinum TaxID=379064 RepID=UPI0032510652